MTIESQWRHYAKHAFVYVDNENLQFCEWSFRGISLSRTAFITLQWFWSYPIFNNKTP